MDFEPSPRTQDYVKRVYRKLEINSKRELREWVSRYASSR